MHSSQVMKLQKKEIITFVSIPPENVRKPITAICIGSVMKVEKKSYPQVYLEQCKYKIKRRKPVDFIDAEIDLSSDDSGDCL